MSAGSSATRVLGRDLLGLGDAIRGTDTVRLAIVCGWFLWTALYCAWPGYTNPALLGLGGVELYVSDMLMLGTIALGARDLLDQLLSSASPVRHRVAAAIVGMYVAYTLGVVIPNAAATGIPVTTLLRLVSDRFAILLIPMVIGLLSRRPHATNLLLAFPGLVALVPAAVGLVRLVTGGGVTYVTGGDVRFRALWGGAVLLFGWPVFAAAGRVIRNIAPEFVRVVAVIGLVLTNHRSGYIAFLATLPLVARPSNRTARWIVVAAGAAAVIVLVVLAVASTLPASAFSYSFARLFDYAGGTGADRVSRWRIAWRVFTDSPFSDVLWVSQDIASGVIPSVAYFAHNWLLEVGVAEGVVGLAAYAGVLATALAGIARRVARDPVVAGMAAFIVFFLVFCLFNTNFYALASVNLLWIACGVILSLLAREPAEGMPAEVS